MRDGVSDMHCMNDAYLVEPIAASLAAEVDNSV